MAYENMTYEFILNRMLDRITSTNPNVDTRESSMIYNAIAPEAKELAEAYWELDNVRNETFILTASREGKIRRCQELGIDVSIFDATACVSKGEFNVPVELGTRWNLDLYNYRVESYLGQDEETQYHMYTMRCETLGTSPNGVLGELTPIDVEPSGLKYAAITELLIEGENETSDEGIETYYLNKVSGSGTDGNVTQYELWCDAYNGIGAYKIFPLWNGNNTVKTSILTTSNDVASSELIREFQEYLDLGKSAKGSITRDETTIVLEDAPPTVSHIFFTKDDVQRLVDPNKYDYDKLGTITFKENVGDDYQYEVYYGNGMGDGVAPIGAFVTVSTATDKSIDVSANILLNAGYSEESLTLIDTAIKEYLSSIAYTSDRLSYIALGAVIQGCEAVEFINELKINGDTKDIPIGEEEILKLGTTDWTVV